MTQRRGFYRKVGYLGCYCCVVVSCVVWDIRPRSTPTGNLRPAVIWPSCVMMKNIGLAKRRLGEDRPDQFDDELATLGYARRCGAVAVGKPPPYQMEEDWSSYSAALEQIIRLEPNFFSFGIFRGTTCRTTFRSNSTITAIALIG